MNIGILTFHWGTNYGGVLQAFALQKYLEKLGHGVFIINYAPYTFRDNFIFCFKSKRPTVIFANLKQYFKERHFVRFRKKHLKTSQRFYNLEELVNNPPQMDAYIAGSDQIWNPYIIDNYGKPYFLGFGNKQIKRIAYAASFGCDKYPKNKEKQLKELLRNFDAISHREKTGEQILSKIKITNSILLPDPTLLLEMSDYYSLIKKLNYKKVDYFFYILQDNQTVIQSILSKTRKENKFVIANTSIKYFFSGIEQWLNYIISSKFIITNSFHGIVFSIIFKKQFVAIPIEGKLEGMNDRINTLLYDFDLESRIIEDITQVETILKTEINWEKVGNKTKELQDKAFKFLTKHITA